MKADNKKITELTILNPFVMFIYMMTVSLVSHYYSKKWGAALVLPAIFLLAREIHRFPKTSKEKMRAKTEAQISPRFEKITSIVFYLILAYMAYALIAYLIE